MERYTASATDTVVSGHQAQERLHRIPQRMRSAERRSSLSLHEHVKLREILYIY